MNKIRKRIISLILIFVSFALMASSCEEIIAAIVATPAATQLAATQLAGATQIAELEGTRITFRATENAADRQTETARPTQPPSPTSTLNVDDLRTRAAAIKTEAAKLTGTPTPQPATITVKVGVVAEFKTFNVSVTKAEYVTGDPKGAYIITVVLENKTSTDLTYSINNFSVTNSAGKNKVLALPKPQGSTWSDDFLPNSSVPAGAKATLQLLAQILSGIEKDFVFGANFGNFTALIPLGR